MKDDSTDDLIGDSALDRYNALDDNGWQSLLTEIELKTWLPLNRHSTSGGGPYRGSPLTLADLAEKVYGANAKHTTDLKKARQLARSRENHVREALRSLAEKHHLLKFMDGRGPNWVVLMTPPVVPPAIASEPGATKRAPESGAACIRTGCAARPNRVQSAPDSGAPSYREQIADNSDNRFPAAPAAASRGKPGSIKGRASTAHAAAVAWWCGPEGWELVEGRKYHFNGGRDGRAMKSILEYTDIEGDLEQFKRIARIYLRDRAPYFEFHPLHRLAENVEKFRAKLAATNAGANHGTSNGGFGGRIGAALEHEPLPNSLRRNQPVAGRPGGAAG